MSSTASRLFRPFQTAFRYRATPITTSAFRTPFASRQFHATRANMTVHNVESVEQFKDIVKNNPVVFVDFFATWCGPCKAIAPRLVDWSNKYPNIFYAKVDVDAIPDLAQEYGIRAMPTFIVLKDGEKVGDLTGADPKRLQELIVNNHPAEAATSA